MCPNNYRILYSSNSNLIIFDCRFPTIHFDRTCSWLFFMTCWLWFRRPSKSDFLRWRGMVCIPAFLPPRLLHTTVRVFAAVLSRSGNFIYHSASFIRRRLLSVFDSLFLFFFRSFTLFTQLWFLLQYVLEMKTVLKKCRDVRIREMSVLEFLY